MGALDTPENKPHKRELCPYQVCQDPFATTWVHCATCAQAYHQQCAHHDAADEPFTCDRCAHKRRRPRSSSLESASALSPRAASAPVATTPQSEGNGQRKREAPVALLASRREAKPPLPPWSRPHEPLFGWEWREVVIALATQYGKQVDPHPAKVARAQSDLGAFYQQLCNANIPETTNKGLKKTVYDLSALSRSPRSHRAIMEISKSINPEIIEDYFAFYEACVAVGVANVPPPQAPGAEWAPPVTSPKLEPAAIVTKRPHTSNSETTPETTSEITSSTSSSSSSSSLSKRPRFDHPSPVSEVEDGELSLKPTMAPWEFQVLAFALAAQYNVDTRSSPEWERRVAADPDECLEFMYQMSLVSPHQELTLSTYTGSYMDTQSPRPFEKWRQLGRRLTPVVVPFYLAYYRVCVEHSIEPKMLI